MENKRQQKHWEFYAVYRRICIIIKSEQNSGKTAYQDLYCHLVYLTCMQNLAFHFKEHMQDCGIFRCQQDSLVMISFSKKP